MSNLSEYINKVKEYKKQNPDLTERELIRYVYLDLGNRFSFNLNYSFGNTKTKKYIYGKSRREEDIDESMETNTVICISASHILEKVLKAVGVDIITVADPLDNRKNAHTYNVVRPVEGQEYIIDLQEDMENIQSHSFTKSFGLSVEPKKTRVISRFEIEQIDRKLGYVRDDYYYADDYLDLFRQHLPLIDTLEEKAELVLNNIDVYENREMQYAERRWHHEKILKELFTQKEMNKIHIIDCYRDDENGRTYQNCVVVNAKKGTEIYLYSVDENRYCKVSMEEFAKMTQEGLEHLQNIQGLQKTLRKLKEDDEGR